LLYFGSSDLKIKQIVEKLKASRYWSNLVIFITFDEHGGRWDHVAPPTVDKWGPGSRVGCVCVSPLCKKKHVESTYYDSTAILKFIEDRFELRNLSSRDAMQHNMDSIFEKPGFLDDPTLIIIVGGVIGGVIFIGIIVVVIVVLSNKAKTYVEV